MGKRKGFVLVYRDIMDHEIWNDKPFARGQAFLQLVLMANHASKTILFNGKPTKVNRGETITSISALADKFGWSRNKTRDFLEVLEKLQMIERHTDTRKTLIKVLNYDVYQPSENKKRQQKGQQKVQQKGSRRTQTMNYNNELSNEIEKSTPVSAAFASGESVEGETAIDRVIRNASGRTDF